MWEAFACKNKEIVRLSQQKVSDCSECVYGMCLDFPCMLQTLSTLFPRDVKAELLQALCGRVSKCLQL